ncbi:MAG: O-succinylbenzoic acid--CoA ligase [Labilithrix sp.]|nr:O-succinylbenzoic acid--CoA ligase [Labilithrix sp.]
MSQEPIQSTLHETRLFNPPAAFSARAHVKSMDEYRATWKRSIEQPDAFWGDIAKELHWFKPWTGVCEWTAPDAKWFVGGQTNLAYNCLDRQIEAGRGDATAILFEGEPYADGAPKEVRKLTYRELRDEVGKVANGLKSIGVKKGDVVTIYMPMVPEAAIAMLACARIGAAHSVVFGGFSAQALIDRIQDADAKLVITSDGGYRRGAASPLKPAVDEAVAQCPSVEHVLVVKRTGQGVEWTDKDVWWSDAVDKQPDTHQAQPFDSENPLFLLYTSGTTGKPKGAVRKFPKDTVQAALRFLNETPLRVDDVHLVTCPLYHSTAYGFMTFSQVLGQTVVIMDEWKPEPFLAIVERHRVTTTAVVPTMLHRLLALPPEVRDRHDTRSLRVVFAGGAPLPPTVATAFMDAFGDILFNFYGSTETGLVTLAKPADLRASPATIGRPLPENEIRLVGDDGREVPDGQVGELYVKNKMLVTGYHEDEAATKDSMLEGFFSVGDLARRDASGRYFIEGRKRDMVISGGVNVYPAEVENALEQHPDVSEVAVVGVPDPEWGERVRAFVVLRPGAAADEAALKAFARERLAGPKVPREYVFVDALPRNPTGKVLKRELRERA